MHYWNFENVKVQIVDSLNEMFGDFHYLIALLEAFIVFKLAFSLSGTRCIHVHILL